MNKNQDLDYCVLVLYFHYMYSGWGNTKQIRKKYKTFCSAETTLQSLVLECDRNFIPWLVPKFQK